MNELLYKAIIDHIRAKLPWLTWIDFFRNQYAIQVLVDEDPPVFENALFIETDDIPWVDMGNKVREASATIALHYVTESYEATWVTNDENVKAFPTDALQWLRNKQAIYKAFSGFSATAATPVQNYPITSGWQAGPESYSTLGALIINIQRFRCHIYDYSAHPAWDQIQMQLQVVIEPA